MDYSDIIRNSYKINDLFRMVDNRCETVNKAQAETTKIFFREMKQNLRESNEARLLLHAETDAVRRQPVKRMTSCGHTKPAPKTGRGRDDLDTGLKAERREKVRKKYKQNLRNASAKVEEKHCEHGHHAVEAAK